MNTNRKTIATAIFTVCVLVIVGLFSASRPSSQTPPVKPEIVSLLGRELYAAPAAGEALEKLKAGLAESQARYKANPNSPDALILFGRSLAALWRFHEAIEVFSDGIARWPENAMLFRHRGHRYISIREFDKALIDLVKARSLKDGDFDILYHLGLAFYLQGRYEKALPVYQACLKAAANEGNSVSVRHWLYMTLRRLGRTEEASALLTDIRPDISVGEEAAYLNLLLLYKGMKTEQDILTLMEASPLDAATMGNGLAVWYLASGRESLARELQERIVGLETWPAFGFIASEAELHRLKNPEDRRP